VHRGFEVVTWRVVFTSQAQRDAKKIARSGLKPGLSGCWPSSKKILPDASPFEKLVGDLAVRAPAA